jgi:predicted DNA-binding transcriptional regulator AlpA
MTDPLLKQRQVAQYIARKLAVSERQVYDRWVHLPNFPKPIVLPTVNGGIPRKRWDKQSIIEWTENQLQAA